MSSIDAAIYNEARKIAAKTGQRRLIYRRVVTVSEVLTLPVGHYDIIAIGAAGSGGRAVGTTPRATGGGGPAWARDWGRFTSPTEVTITIGARALGAASGTGAANGNTGGTTTITGIESPITLTGGQAGAASIGVATDLPGGLGGVASGGKVSANGGRGGNISSSTSTGGNATGGGAVDIYCLGANRTRGGDITGRTTTGSIGTGGAGVGGRAGDSTSSTGYNTAGGGAGGDALDVTATATSVGPTITGGVGDGVSPPDVAVADVLLNYPCIAPTASGSSVSATVPQSGGGSCGGSDVTAVTIPFGATGGGTNGSTGGPSKTSDRGGGSGGQVSTASAQLSGAAGQAFAVISVYAEVA